MAESPIQLFAEKFQVNGLKKCWPWIGYRNQYGYGKRFSKTLCPKETTAHRVMWLLENGEIPEGMSVLHRCDNPPCVNPNHLFLGTQAENIKDMEKKGRRRTFIGPKPWRKNCKRNSLGRFYIG